MSVGRTKKMRLAYNFEEHLKPIQGNNKQLFPEMEAYSKWCWLLISLVFIYDNESQTHTKKLEIQLNCIYVCICTYVMLN